MKNLISLLVTPIIFISGCMYADQVRIPLGIPRTYSIEVKDGNNIKSEKISAYENMFNNILYGSDILETKEPNGFKTTYIGYGALKKLSFIELGKGFKSKRVNVEFLKPDQKSFYEKRYNFYIDEINKIEKEREEKRLIEEDIKHKNN